MRMRVVIFLRPRTVMILLARKDKQWGGQAWLADQMGVSQAYVSHMLAGRKSVPAGRQGLVINAFRGMSHKRGGRVTWDDLFMQTIMDETATAGGI